MRGPVNVEQIGPYLWQIPLDAKRGMRVPGLILADAPLMAQIRRDASLEQVANAAALPGIVKASFAMPDIHQGYGLPVGGVVATDAETGVVSPGGVGYDINCGVRLSRTNLAASDVLPRLRQLVDALYQATPAGVGSRSALKL
ncbi:MAG: RtcB family protein, partial [Candidatus Rokuibacteriota bacterium]